MSQVLGNVQVGRQEAGQIATQQLYQEQAEEIRAAVVRGRRDEIATDDPEPPEAEDRGDSEARLSDGDRVSAGPSDHPPRTRDPFRRMAVRFAITAAFRVRPVGPYARLFREPPPAEGDDPLPPLVPRGRIAVYRHALAAAVARHLSDTVKDESGRWPASLRWTDVPAVGKFDDLLALVDDRHREQVKQRARSQGAMLKRFALALPDGSVVALSALIDPARRTRRATRAGALRAAADRPRPATLAGEAWDEKDWKGVGEAERKAQDDGVKKKEAAP